MDGATGRNLMGQVDGTKNPRPTDPDFAGKIFAAGPDWLAGGSYLVVRRIRMLLDSWDQVPVADQERVIGRRKDDGGPLSGGSEFTPANFGARNATGDWPFRPTPTCGWPRPPSTTALPCCDGVSPMWMVSRPGYCSWPGRLIRGVASSRCSGGWWRPTRCAGSFGTRRVRCLPCRVAWRRAARCQGLLEKG